MKPLIVLTRIMCVGLFWSVFFIEGVRVIMLKNWYFDIFQTAHWQHAWNLWMSGWVINTPKEWAFVLIVLTFIPLWLSGWAALSMIRWEKIFIKILRLPWITFKRGFFKPVKIIAHSSVQSKAVKKKKSYKDVRPRSLRLPLDERPEPVNTSKLVSATSKVKPLVPAIAAAEAPAPSMVAAKPSIPPSPNTATASEGAAFTHSLFNMDENLDDDFDFDIDSFDLDKASAPDKEDVSQPASPPPAKRAPQQAQAQQGRNPKKDRRPQNQSSAPMQAQNNSRGTNAPAQQNNSKKSGSGSSILDVIRQHGFETINGATIKNTLVDFIGVAKGQIVLCLIDKEPGDWLADEERFNDEEPLWFSESSHRISPVRKVDLACKFLQDKLAAADMVLNVVPYVIISIGNIINAEDMFDIWGDLGVKVVRIDRGTPKDIPLFAKELPDAEAPLDRDTFEKVKKLIRNIA